MRVGGLVARTGVSGRALRCYRRNGDVGLPTFGAGGGPFSRRLILIARDTVIEHVFHPVPAPDRHAAGVVSWLDRRYGIPPARSAAGSGRRRVS